MVSITEERAKLAAVGQRLRRREEWGARQSYTSPRAVTEPASRVFVHITVTQPSNYSGDDAHARAIEAIGQARFGSGVSYNRLHFQSGTAAEGQAISRRGTHTGAYSGNCTESGCPNRGGNVSSANHNVTGRGYVICQNVQHPVTDAQFDALARSIAADMLAGFVARTAPIHGHRCVSDKSCPGPLMWARMGALEQRVIDYVRTGLPDGEDDMATPQEIWDYNISTGVAGGEDADKLLSQARTFSQLARDNTQGLAGKVDALADQVAALAVKVDELVAQPPGSTVVSGLTDEALAAVADAVAAEQGQRLTTP